jgi:hypothetical protein
MSGSTMLMALSNTGQMSGSAPAMSAVTASYADNFLVKGNLTAQTLVVQTITSSVSTITGSTNFGSIIDNIHTFTGSINVSGSIDLTNILSLRGNTILSYDDGASSPRLGIGFAPQSFAKAVIVDNSTDYGLFVRQNNSSGKIADFNDPSGNSVLSILATGSVGIGTSTPTEMLHLNNSSGVAAFIRFQGTGGGGVYIGNRSNNMELYAGGSERMRITSDGNVGIGTNSPIAYSGYTSLTIGGSNTGLLKFRSAYNSGDGAEIYQNTSGTIFFNTNGSQGAMAITSGGALAIGTSTITYSNYKFQARVASDRNLAIGVQGTDVSIEAYNDAVSANVPLRIYGNNISLIGGSVLKPNNPAFRAYYSVNSTWALAAEATFVFNATEYNIGSCYNTSNGRFTAPVAGVYQFNFYSIVLGNYQNAAISFRRNGGVLTSGFNMHFSPYYTSTSWSNVVYTTSLYLNAGDYVSMISGESINYHGDDWSSFSGYLVG